MDIASGRAGAARTLNANKLTSRFLSPDGVTSGGCPGCRIGGLRLPCHAHRDTGRQLAVRLLN